MPTLFPNQLDTDINLPNIVDVETPTLTITSISPTDNSISVISTEGYAPQHGLITIDSEQITYDYTTNNQFIGCYRGFGQTPVTSHNVGSKVLSYVTAAAYTNLRDAILQLQQFCGINGDNIAQVQQTNNFKGSQQLSNGLLLNTPASTGLDEWTIAPTNDGTSAVLNFIYNGNAGNNLVNMPGLSIAPHNIAFIKTVNFSTTPIFDMFYSPNQIITLTGDVTSSSIINAAAGQIFILQIKQDNVGGHNFVFPTNFKSPPLLDKTANTTSVMIFWYDGTNAWPTWQTGLV